MLLTRFCNIGGISHASCEVYQLGLSAHVSSQTYDGNFAAKLVLDLARYDRIWAMLLYDLRELLEACQLIALNVLNGGIASRLIPILTRFSGQ